MPCNGLYAFFFHLEGSLETQADFFFNSYITKTQLISHHIYENVYKVKKKKKYLGTFENYPGEMKYE